MYNEVQTCDGCDDVAEEQRLVVSEDRPGTAIARWFCRRHVRRKPQLSKQMKQIYGPVTMNALTYQRGRRFVKYCS